VSDQLNSSLSPQPAVNPLVKVPEGEKYTTLMVQHLRNTRPWVLFLGIVMIVVASFMAIAGLVMIGSAACMGMGSLGNSSFSSYSSGDVTTSATMLVIMGFVYLALPAVYIPLIVFMFRYASSMKALLTKGKTADLENALGHQKSYWKYIGVLTIALLGVAVLVIIGSIIVGVVLAMNNMNTFHMR